MDLLVRSVASRLLDGSRHRRLPEGGRVGGSEDLRERVPRLLAARPPDRQQSRLAGARR